MYMDMEGGWNISISLEITLFDHCLSVLTNISSIIMLAEGPYICFYLCSCFSSWRRPFEPLVSQQTVFDHRRQYCLDLAVAVSEKNWDTQLYQVWVTRGKLGGCGSQGGGEGEREGGGRERERV